MNRAGFLVTASTAGLAVIAPAALAADGARVLTFTTSSPEARAQVVETIRRVETFHFAPRIREAAQKAVELDPDFAFAHYLLGLSFPPPQARPHLDKAAELARKASDGERRYIEAGLLNRAQKPKEAVAAFEALQADYPGERMVYMMLGQLYASEGRIEKARLSYEKARTLDGSTARVHAVLANLHLLQGEYGKARELYHAALARRAPGTAPGLPSYGIAFTYLYEGQPDQALQALQGFLDEFRRTGGNPNLPEVFIWNSIARINLENGRLDAAMTAYEKGFQSVPGSPLADQDKKLWLGRLHHGRGRTLARMGKHAEAWKEAETIKAMIGEGGEAGKQFLPAYHYLAGYLRLEAGEAAAALVHLKQADQTDPFHKLLLARAYEKLGQKEEARKVYRDIVETMQNSLERALAYPEARRRLEER